MNNDRPLVSVLMTAYNREEYIAEAISSVLASTYTHFELIIADDCSTDNTAGVAKAFETKDPRIKIYQNKENLGDYPNRNQAASYAAGKYIKYFDSDDIMYPHCLEVMVNAMEAFPGAGFGLSSKVDKYQPFPICVQPADIYRESFFEYYHFGRAPGSSIIKTDVFRQLRGFSGERMVGDLEFWLRIARYHTLVKFPHDLYWNRIHDGQEFQTDYAKNIYPKRTKELILEALNHADCPLSRQEAQEIARRYNQRLLRKKLREIISSFKKMLSGS